MENKYFNISIHGSKFDKSWHDAIIITNIRTGCYLKLQETIMGCGIVQIYGISTFYSYSTEELEELKDILNNQITQVNVLLKDNYRCMKVGLIIATLGEAYRNGSYELNELKLKQLGFTELSNYSNWRHDESGNEIQKLYGLKTNYNNIINKGT